MSEKYPSGMPPSDGGMTAVYEDARNWALSMKCSVEEKREKIPQYRKDGKPSDNNQPKYRKDDKNWKEKRSQTPKDESMVSWVPSSLGKSSFISRLVDVWIAGS